MAGNSYGTGLSDYVTLKLNSSYGDLIWVKRYDGGSYDFISGLEVNSANDLFVTGSSSISGQSDIVSIKYKSNGSIAWTKTYGSSNDNDNARDLSIDNGGNIYITGSSQTVRCNFRKLRIINA